MCRNIRIKVNDTIVKQMEIEISPVGTDGEKDGRIQSSFEFYKFIK
jgi:hypothetical protein